MLLFKRNTLEYLGVCCDGCADARDAGPLDVLTALGWQIAPSEENEDLCPQCNPGFPLGSAEGRRDTERADDERAHAESADVQHARDEHPLDQPALATASGPAPTP